MSATPPTAEEALEDFVARLRRGESVDARSYAARHPDLGAELESALAAAASLHVIERAASADDRTLLVPERVGPFRVLREIGRGGMGVVLEAVEEPLERRVALKLLTPELLASPAARARFRREAELAARLDHPGIATVYGAGVSDARPWIAMRFVDGETLSHAIHRSREAGGRCVVLDGSPRRGREAVLAVAECVARVAHALAFAHERGVVHRDVKPSNVIVTAGGAPVLLDFGLAITDEHDAHGTTKTGETPGTPAYLSPEHVGGVQTRHDAQSDVYALGVTLHECLTLRRPFEAPTPAALYRAILFDAVPSVRACNRDVPPDLAVVVATAIERDRSRRYASAAKLAADLEACVAGRPIAARPVPWHGRLARWARREPRQAALGASLLVATVVAALFGGSWWSSREEVHAAEALARSQAIEGALEEGFRELGQGRTITADDAFERALVLDPASVEARVGLVVAGIARKDDALVRARIGALPVDLRGVDALRALAAHAPIVGNTLETLPPTTRALELFVCGLCWQTDATRRPYSEQGASMARALALYSEAIARAPVARALYQIQRASVAQYLGDAKAARSASAALTTLWPASARALYGAGQALVLIDPTSARPLLERSIAIDPSPVDTYNLLAQACKSSGDPAAAEGWCRRGLAREPRAAVLQFLLGDALEADDCIDDAREAFEAAERLDPRLFAALSRLGSYAFIAGDDATSLGYYRRALDLDQDNHRARMFFGAVLDRSGDTRGARENLDYAIAGLYPADVGYWRQVAGFFAYLKAFDATRMVAEAGLAATPNDAELSRQHADALAALGR